jgi:nickel/cobalt transporter (NicO) family protein
LPLVSVTLGSAGRAPELEAVSRGLLGLIGLWMLWQAIRNTGHVHGQGAAAGFSAGLIPCPLTLFVMTFAITRGVPQAGIAFAAVMMLGVAVVLCTVALLAILFRTQMLRLFESRPALLQTATRTLQIVAGLVLIAIAANALV